MSRNRAHTIRLIAIVVAAVATVAVANRFATVYLASSSTAGAPLLLRSDRIQFFVDGPLNPPSPPPPPQLLLMGNSHTFTLPGIKRGQGLRVDALSHCRFLLDELADRLDRKHPKSLGSYYLLAYPNFLPYEMLTCVSQLYQRGYQPDVAAIGITWRNIARDSQLRHSIRQKYRLGGFAEAFSKMMEDPAVQAGAPIFNAIAADKRRIQTDEEKERVRSDADRLDGKLTDWVAQGLTLLGGSGNLRAYIQMDFIDSLQNAIIDRVHRSYEYDLIDTDYQFNWICLRALMRLLRSRGSQVILYLAPQRTDVPPILDPAGEQKFNEQLRREAAALGVIVLDARHVVPNQYWGWEHDSPDRSHFTEPGHQLLGQFLADEIERRHLWPPQASAHGR